jgi:hypothetical protein
MSPRLAARRRGEVASMQMTDLAVLCRSISNESLAILKNAEIIAVNQVGAWACHS